MKIAHISDLHLDANYKESNRINTLQLLDYISDSNFDHVIISGDITENAESTAFELARNIFKKYDLLRPDKLTLTIGNHDIFGGVHLAEDVVNFPSKCRKTNFHQKVKEFAHYFRETFSKNIYNSDNIFPFVKELDDVIITGLNSIAYYSIYKNPFASNGKISTSQIEQVGKILEERASGSKRRIVVSHHHFKKDSNDNTTSSATLWQAVERQTMKLRNKKKVIKRLANIGTEYLLHGHLHESGSYKRKNIQFLNAGGSVLGNNFGKLAVNEITVNSDGISHKITLIDKKKPFNFEENNNTSIPSYLLHTKEICLN